MQPGQEFSTVLTCCLQNNNRMKNCSETKFTHNNLSVKAQQKEYNRVRIKTTTTAGRGNNTFERLKRGDVLCQVKIKMAVSRTTSNAALEWEGQVMSVEGLIETNRCKKPELKLTVQGWVIIKGGVSWPYNWASGWMVNHSQYIKGSK